MTRSPSSPAEPLTRGSAARFEDALTGTDGTADPAIAVLVPELFVDPMADDYRSAALPALPAVPARAVLPSAVLPAPSAVLPPAALLAPPAVPARAVAPGPAGPDPGPFAPAPMPASAPGSPGTGDFPLRAAAAPQQLADPSRAALRPIGPAHSHPGALPPGRPGALPARYGAPPRTSSYSLPAPRATRYPPRPAPRTTAVRGASVDRRAAQNSRKSAGAWGAIFAALLFLLISGAGRQLLDAVTDLLNR